MHIKEDSNEIGNLFSIVLKRSVSKKKKNQFSVSYFFSMEGNCLKWKLSILMKIVNIISI
ncbi:hypothetical protein Hanom_Chr07g00656801 [Helianthus anomalus]